MLGPRAAAVGLAMARQLSREQGITLRGSAEIVAEFFCESSARPGGRAAGRGPGLCGEAGGRWARGAGLPPCGESGRRRRARRSEDGEGPGAPETVLALRPFSGSAPGSASRSTPTDSGRLAAGAGLPRALSAALSSPPLPPQDRGGWGDRPPGGALRAGAGCTSCRKLVGPGEGREGEGGRRR